MIGDKLYARKDRVYLFALLYAILALAGGFVIAQAISRNETAPGASGFLVIFGAGMCIMTLIKGRQPQVAVHEDFIELKQSRKKELIRYRNIVGISRPDSKRLVVTLHEDRSRKEVVIWLKDLNQSDIEMLADFLAQRKGKT